MALEFRAALSPCSGSSGHDKRTIEPYPYPVTSAGDDQKIFLNERIWCLRCHGYVFWVYVIRNVWVKVWEISVQD